jgi:hypothetical protein
MRRLSWVPLCVLFAACGPLQTSRSDYIPNRDDIAFTTYHVPMHSGFSDKLTIRVADPGADGMLIEVSGPGGGIFRLTSFLTPDGSELVEDGTFITRDAREYPGLVDWLYPNMPQRTADSGDYKVTIAGQDRSGGTIDGDLMVRVYLTSVPDVDTPVGNIALDFLVLDGALPSLDLLDQVVDDINHIYAQANLSIDDYDAITVSAGSPVVPLDTSPGGPVFNMVGAAQQQGKADSAFRPDAVHVIIVSEIQSSDSVVPGYSLGLPGPFDPGRPNSAVLVASSPFLAPTEGTLDIHGMATTCAHEIAHYLGLYHTSEQSGILHDPIPDTPECAPDADPCPDQDNIMFWTGGTARKKLSEGQMTVMHRHPIVRNFAQ